MDLTEAINKSRVVYAEAQEKQNKKQITKRATHYGIVRTFNYYYTWNDWGNHPILTKQESNMIHGFIKVLKNNHYEDADIYQIVIDFIEKYDDIKDAKYISHGKPYQLGMRPNLKDFLLCRNQIIEELSKVEKRKSQNDLADQPLDGSKEQDELFERLLRGE